MPKICPTNAIKNSNNLIAKQQEYNDIHTENLNKIERIMAKFDAIANTKEAHESLKMAIMNTYKTLNGHSQNEENISLLNALNYIKTYITDLEKVNNLLLKESQN
nr:hypothetical transcript [Hymenolepis microstoma]